MRNHNSISDIENPPRRGQLPGVCAAEPVLLRTRPDGALLSIIFNAYEKLCASNDRIRVCRALVLAGSRNADFYRADFHLTNCKCLLFIYRNSSCRYELVRFAPLRTPYDFNHLFIPCDVIGFHPHVGCCEGNEPHQAIDSTPQTCILTEAGKAESSRFTCCC